MNDPELVKALRCLEQNIDQRYEECDKHGEGCDGCPFNVDIPDIDDFSTRAEYVIGLAAARLEALTKEDT